ncbi:MAG: hypothetical protein ACLQDY_01380 [Streptosporangiaceae bacterium]
MTADKRTKHAARDTAAREGISYTAARRRLEEQNQSPAVEQLSEEPPRLYPIVMTPCTHGCVGTPHPGCVCETWHPFSRITGRPCTSWATCQAANLPRGRAESLTDRFREKPLRLVPPGRHLGAGAGVRDASGPSTREAAMRPK